MFVQTTLELNDGFVWSHSIADLVRLVLLGVSGVSGIHVAYVDVTDVALAFVWIQTKKVHSASSLNVCVSMKHRYVAFLERIGTPLRHTNIQ